MSLIYMRYDGYELDKIVGDGEFTDFRAWLYRHECLTRFGLCRVAAHNGDLRTYLEVIFPDRDTMLLMKLSWYL